MKVVVAIDSFKGSMTSVEAGNAVAEGFKKADSEVIVTVRPLADGGEGTVEALTAGLHGKREEVLVTGPLGEPVKSVYGILEDSRTAIIEMSSAAGITLVEKDKLNPFDATTKGVGEIIRDAINKGCRRFIVGIGGSATNDGGAGMLQALGFDLLDKEGRQIPRGAKGLKALKKISDSNVIPELKECEFKIACDVTNPLCGPNGCSAVFASQKGASEDMIRDMDSWLSDYARLSMQLNPQADPDYPGCGAAGGMGFAFLSFTNATLQSGIDLVIEETKLEEYIKESDLVVTGEGRLDFQTAMGKAPVGVACLAKKYDKKVIAFAGSISEDAAECNKKGIDAFFAIVRGAVSLEEAMDKINAENNLKLTAEQVMRLIMSASK